MPTISVIIASRNRAAFLPHAVQSAQAAGRNIKVMVDDASADETPEVCRQLSGIRYFRLERQLGPGEARNVGLIHSSSDYVSFLDDDDLRLPGSLDVQTETLNDCPEVGLVYGQP